jgi:hypothetical protein
MGVPVLIEPTETGRYRGQVFDLVAEGETPDEVRKRLQELLRQRQAAGAHIVWLAAETPWPPMTGSLKDNPLYDEWREAMAEYRRQVEADPNY